MLYEPASAKQIAFVDSSFWTVAFGARVEVFLPRVFDLRAPATVRQEMVGASRRAGGATYPYAEAFHLWHRVGLLALTEPDQGWPGAWGPERFTGKGEQHVLQAAAEFQSVPLINEAPAWRFGADCGLPVLHVPGWIVYLVARRIVTPGTGLQALLAVDRGQRTQQVFVQEARTALHRLEEAQGNG